MTDEPKKRSEHEREPDEYEPDEYEPDEYEPGSVNNSRRHMVASQGFSATKPAEVKKWRQVSKSRYAP